MSIPIIEQIRIYNNEALTTRENVATIDDRDAIQATERFNGMTVTVRSTGKRYELLYAGDFEALTETAKNIFLSDNTKWKEISYERKIDSVTGTAVDNTDPKNPIIDLPKILSPYRKYFGTEKLDLEGLNTYKRIADWYQQAAATSIKVRAWGDQSLYLRIMDEQGEALITDKLIDNTDPEVLTTIPFPYDLEGQVLYLDIKTLGTFSIKEFIVG